MITVRPAAVQELKRLVAKRPAQHSQVYLSLASGSCAEWTYVFDLGKSPQANDAVFDCQGLTIVVSKADLVYLQELTIDYSEDLMGGGFRFINPQAHYTCGCGNSFSITPSSVPGTEDCMTSSTAVNTTQIDQLI